MKVLLIGPLPAPIDGCSYANSILCKNLKKNGISYRTINTNTKSVSSNQGSRFSLKKACRFISTYFHCHKMIQAKVVYFTPGQTFFGLVKYAPFILTCIAFRRPYIIHVHGNFLGKQYSLLKGIKAKAFRFLISKASAGIVLSTSLKSNFKNLLPSEKVHVVENFVADELFNQSSNIEKAKDKPRLLYLSNLMREKGILELLDALLLLKEQKIDFYAEFAGKIEQDIQDIVSEKLNSLGKNAKYLGIVKDNTKIAALRNANIFILPTYYTMEGQPISLLEGMASGNIIVTTKHAGIPDIVDGQNGFFVERNSPSSISKVIKAISLNLEQNVSKFSRFNTLYASKRFTENEFYSNIISIIQSVTPKK